MKLDLEPFYHEGWYGIMLSVNPNGWDAATLSVWCSQTFGQDRKRWRDQLYQGIAYFRDASDRTLFMMKWA